MNADNALGYRRASRNGLGRLDGGIWPAPPSKLPFSIIKKAPRQDDAAVPIG